LLEWAVRDVAHVRFHGLVHLEDGQQVRALAFVQGRRRAGG